MGKSVCAFKRIVSGSRAVQSVRMRILAFLLGVFFMAGAVLDAFQTIILPRRPKGRFRITRLFYLVTWRPWVSLAEWTQDRRLRDQIFSVFGPLSLLVLLVVWATLLAGGFGLLYFAFGTPFNDALHTSEHGWAQLRTDFYVSGTTLFTLGLGDVTPRNQTARVCTVLESGMGLAFVALVIGYVPVLYQAFSRREILVALLDGRAGSPPTAAELLRRHGYEGGQIALIQLLSDWERWAAELLESHVSYPILCYYRSQHDNQNWLSALVCVLDTCAVLMATMHGEAVRQAQLTFTVGRHALVDIGHIFNITENWPGTLETGEDRMPPDQFGKLCGALGELRMELCNDDAARQRLTSIRALYEPQALSLCTFLRLNLPTWMAKQGPPDMWERVSAFIRPANEALRIGDGGDAREQLDRLHHEEH